MAEDDIFDEKQCLHILCDNLHVEPDFAKIHVKSVLAALDKKRFNEVYGHLMLGESYDVPYYFGNIMFRLKDDFDGLASGLVRTNSSAVSTSDGSSYDIRSILYGIVFIICVIVILFQFA